jgi:hypothetical protein
MSIHGKSKSSLAVAALLLLVFVVAQAMGQPGAPTTPSIIFVGTIDALQAVTLPSLTPSPNTSVVAVERVLRKPEAITLDQGDKVTVLTEGGAPLQKGMHALFFTDGWIFGESLAVRVLSWEPVSSVRAGAGAGAAEDAKVTAQIQQIQASADKDIQSAIESADIVIVGRVKRIQPPSVAALAPERQMVTEHNPDWQEAIIEVQSALKGAAGAAEVVVRFPASMDVMWAGYPKLKEGQEGTFLLHQDRLSASPTATLEGRAVTAYMVISSKHVLSSGDSERIKGLLAR